IQKLEPSPCRAFCEQLRELIPQALRRNLRNLASMPADGLKRGCFHAEPKTSGKAHGAQQAQLVLTKAAIRFANCPNEADLQIGLPPDVVEHFPGVVTH